MGVEVVDEQPFEVTRTDGTTLDTSTTSGCACKRRDLGGLPHEKLRDLFEGAVAAVWTAAPRATASNRLVLAAQLTCARSWCCARSRSTCARPGPPTRQDYLEDALVSHPAIARDLVDLWRTRSTRGATAAATTSSAATTSG